MTSMTSCFGVLHNGFSFFYVGIRVLPKLDTNLVTTAVSFHWKMNSHKMIRNRKCWTDKRQASATKKSPNRKDKSAKMCLWVIQYFFILYTFVRKRTWGWFKAYSCWDVMFTETCYVSECCWILFENTTRVSVLGQSLPSLIFLDSKPDLRSQSKRNRKQIASLHDADKGSKNGGKLPFYLEL